MFFLINPNLVILSLPTKLFIIINNCDQINTTFGTVNIVQYILFDMRFDITAKKNNQKQEFKQSYGSRVKKKKKQIAIEQYDKCCCSCMFKKKNAVGTLRKPQRPWRNQERTLRESAIAGELEG